MKHPFIPFFVVLTTLLLGCSETQKYDTVISNVNLFDGEKNLGVVNIGVNNDSIAVISTHQLLSENMIDGKGKFVMPGMVNSHTHMTSIENVKEGFSHGILANLNMHTGNESLEGEWKKMSRDSTNFPLLFGAGYAATVPGGHPTQFSRDMETISDSVSIKKWVNNRIENGADYIKIVRDDHPFLQYPPGNTLTYEQIDSIILYARNRGYKTVVHAVEPDQFLRISQSNPNGFIHTQVFVSDIKLDKSDWQLIKESGVFFTPNFMLDSQNQDFEDESNKKWAVENFLSIDEYIEFVKEIHNNGITLLAGTDSPNAGLNFGSDFIEELKFFKRIGLSNEEILRTATGNPAKAFDLPVGLLKEGSKANFVLFTESPLDDLNNIEKIEIIWKNGIRN